MKGDEEKEKRGRGWGDAVVCDARVVRWSE